MTLSEIISQEVRREDSLLTRVQPCSVAAVATLPLMTGQRVRAPSN